MSITRFFFLFAFLLLSAITIQAKTTTNALQCRAIHISDGDSFTCLTNNHKRIKVRLVGIDAPENGQVYGKQAKQQLAKLIHKQSVTLKIDGIDQYARRLATVYDMQHQNINRLMVESGYAWAYRFYKKDPQYQQAQLEAQWKKRGLWQDRHPQEPYLWRKEQR
ncbi:thermonuclease family protein [Testudinibacter sp. P80/BLE/0925]|uniref:thermonuclease family protein n=1 Tax=Testudinibacter sp. TW-1 TaxID=3417757 RepID=UPI003D3628CE